MAHRIPSLVLLVLLTVLVGAKDLALGFCLCEKSLFFAGSSCCVAIEEKECDADCECLESEPATIPCEDCVVLIQLEVEDYLWSAPSFEVPEVELSQTQQSRFAPTEFADRNSPKMSSFALKRPPPPDAPLFLHHRALLL